MTITDQIIIDALQIAQEKQRIYEAIKRKRGIDFPYNPLSGYSDAIDKITTRGIPTMIANMSFEVGDEPTTGNVWYVKAGVSGNRTGTSWDSAFATRQEAVNAASSGDRVYVWEGTYYLTAAQTPKAGVSEYYGFNGDGTWATRQPFTNPSKHDAQFTANNYINADVTFTTGQIIDGLWVQNTVTSSNGGGMLLSAKSHLRNCVIVNCSTSAYGGGIYITGSSTMVNCVIVNCSTSAYGGGIYITGSSTMVNCVIANCACAYGGGVALSGINTKIIACVIMNCRATNGGGAYALNTSTMTNCIIINCSGTSAGGGVYALSNNALTNCIIINCSSTIGGGVYGDNVSRCFNVSCCLCSALSGSGIYFTNNAVTLYNCVVYGCNIHLNAASAAYKIYNCASDNALTGVSGWDTNADVQSFLSLSTFPFAAAGISPFDAVGAFYQSLPQGEEALAFIDRVVIPSLVNPRPHSTSPLIGAGYYEAGVTPDTDADGNERPLTPSIGAYEYVEEA